MEYLPLILFVISTSITPGPNNILILASGVNHGVIKSLPHFFGIGVGFLVMAIAVGLGAGNLFNQFPILQIGLKTLGVFYLLYLTFMVATAPIKLDAENKKPFTFMQAVLFQWVNPKAWVMIIGAVVTFSTASNHFLLQVVIIAFVFVSFGLPCVGLWLLFGVSLKKLLSNPTNLRIFNVTMAILLGTSLVPIACELYTYYAG